MSAAPAALAGRYRLESLVGCGGMGDVYRAQDERLKRTVAIKVIRENIASDPAFLERFSREARAVAAVNHPHICTVYDSGEHDGTPYIVMEYLEGESLAERLKRGPLKHDDAVQYAIQIADALATKVSDFRAVSY